MSKERRRHFLINKPLQFRYMIIIVFTLLTVTSVSLANIYFGIWSGILSALSDEQVRNDLLTASRLQEYEDARTPGLQPKESFSPFSFVLRMERLGERQREVAKELLNHVNRNLTKKFLWLFLFIALGTIFLSHKIAGPLYRFQKVLERLDQGDLTVRCHLRKFDEAQPVAEDFNRTLEFLDRSLARLKAIVRKNEKNPENLSALLKEELSKFKTTD